MKYIPSLITGILTITGNIYGGVLAWSNVIFVLVLLVLLELILKPDTTKPADDDAFIPNLVLLFHVLLHTASIASLLYGVYFNNLNGWSFAGAVFSTGLNSGASGIVSAHELIHRKQNYWQNLGIWNLFLVHYTHYYIEHIQNHHKNVGTKTDPATAFSGESLYQFIFRTIPGQFLSALKIAGERKNKSGNFVFNSVLLNLAVDVVIFYFFGKMVLLAFVLQSLIGILLLEYVNYIEHYGLVRDEGTKFGVAHAWQSNTITSRITLLELSRHTDHHIKASKPYHTLISHPDSPELPVGYFGMFYVCLIPPLWFKMIDPLIKSNKDR